MPHGTEAVTPNAPRLHALITGASRGIGRALIDALLSDAATATVFAASRRGALEPTSEASHSRLHVLTMDVTNEPSVQAAAAKVSARTERLDLIVNCAGVLHDGDTVQPEKRLADVTPAGLARSFAVNAMGPLLVAKHFQHLLPRRERAIFASLSARVGSIADNRLGGWYGYRSSKAAQNMVTRNLSIELRRSARGVICVALHPGTVDSDLSRPFQRNVPSAQLFTPERAAHQLLAVINGLAPEDNGSFLAWDGQPIPW